MSMKLPLTRLGVWKSGLALLLLPTLGWAQAQAPAPAAAGKSCIWFVKGEKATVYLAGSIHLLRANDLPIPADYDKVYADSKQLFFEIDPEEMASAASQMKMMTLSMLPDGKSVDKVISKETYAKLEAYMDSRDLGILSAAFLNMKPAMLSVMISSLEMMRLGAQPQFGVETIFSKKAKTDAKPVEGLETVEFQLGMFDKLSPEMQENFLKMTLDQVEELPKMLETLIDCWKKGEDVKLGALLNEEFDGHDDLHNTMLTDRNKNWLPVVEKQLASPDGNTLFIVGAGHLIGEGSVVDLLQKKGHKVERYIAP